MGHSPTLGEICALPFENETNETTESETSSVTDADHQWASIKPLSMGVAEKHAHTPITLLTVPYTQSQEMNLMVVPSANPSVTTCHISAAWRSER